MVHHSKNERSGQSTSSLITQGKEQPIIAIATANGRGSIGVIRVSGTNLESFYQDITGLVLTNARYANYLPIVDDDGSLIDDAIVIFFKGPHSYTGEDVLEIQGHGGNAVMQLLLQRCLNTGQSIGLRLAEPGEFTLRAFLNDKIDLAQAEAVSDMIEASSAAAAKAAAASLSGAFSSVVNTLADQVLQVRTLVEATLDFPEEEIDFIEKYEVKQKLASIAAHLQQTLTISKQSSALKDGLKVVLAGEPNVGKSSLMNTIFSQDIAIVTDIAGTTRDRIRESLVLEGVPVLITDTAGLRDTEDEIESLGIERTWQAIAESDLILDVCDVQHPESFIQKWKHRPELHDKSIVTVFNKCDLLTKDKHPLCNDIDTLCLSAKTGLGLDHLREVILQAAGRQVGEVSPWLGRKRHIDALNQAMVHLSAALEHAQFNDQVLDLVAEELRLTHQTLGEITGHVSADELLGNIFSSFCIGK